MEKTSAPEAWLLQQGSEPPAWVFWTGWQEIEAGGGGLRTLGLGTGPL